MTKHEDKGKKIVKRFVSIKPLYYSLIFIFFQIVVGVVYYFFNKNIKCLSDISLTILGINLTALALNTTSLIGLVNWLKSHVKRLLEEKGEEYQLGIKYLQQLSNMLISYMNISAVISIIVSFVVLIFNLSALTKNVLSIIAVAGTLNCLLILIRQTVFMLDRTINFVKFVKKKDVMQDEKLNDSKKEEDN